MWHKTLAKIKWHGMLKIEDIQLRRSRYGDIYAVLYTNSGGNIIATEHQASRLCLFEPYQMRGEIKPYFGGQYLKLGGYELFDSSGYRLVI